MAAAIRFIRQQACRGITVKDVVAAVDVSRSTLERKLVNSLGRSPSAEIHRVRMEEARRLLIETDSSVASIATRTGFSSTQYFCAAFLHANGCTAGEYRRSKSR